MLRALRRCLHLLDVGRRGRWILLVGLAVVVGIVEAGGALLVFSLLSLVTSPDSPTALPVLGDLRDRFADLSSAGDQLTLVAVVVAFFLIRAGLYLLQSYARTRVAHNTGVQLSLRLLGGYLAMPYAFHLKRNSAELLRNTHYSVLDLVVHAFVPIVVIASEAILIFGILIALVLTAPLVTLLILGVLGPLVIVLLRLVQPALQRLGDVNQETLAMNVKSLQQSFEGARDIKLSGSERFFQSQFEGPRRRLAVSLYRKELLQDVPRVAIETSIMIFVVGFVGYSLAGKGETDRLVAVMGLFTYAIFRVLPSLNRILANLNLLRFGFAAIDDLYEDLVATELFTNDDLSYPPLSFARVIELSDVSFSYDGSDRQVLREVDLAIAKGECIGFVGATGSGKSTLVNIILGLLEPTSGRVSVDGVDVMSNKRGWYRQIGVVPQHVFLVDDSLRRNIAFGVADEEIDEVALDDAIDMSQLRPFLEELPDGLETVVGERGVRLSGGEAQRIAIARALYRRPEVLFLDEGTSALDNTTESRFMAALDALKASKTLVMIAHRLSTIKKCDRVVLMEAGRIADIGTYEELVARNDTFRAMAT